MEQSNATREFLGDESQWPAISVELYDVQGLWGGRRILLEGTKQAVVQRVDRSMSETRYEFILQRQDLRRLVELLIEVDFVKIRPEERAGFADEGRPTIRLTNASGAVRAVSKWAGAKDERFDIIYDALVALEGRTGSLAPGYVGVFMPDAGPTSGSTKRKSPIGSPFTRMSELEIELGARSRKETVDGTRLQEVLTVATSLERLHDWATEMELGAQGFDNLDSAGAYAEVKRHLMAAATELEAACGILRRLDLLS